MELGRLQVEVIDGATYRRLARMRFNDTLECKKMHHSDGDTDVAFGRIVEPLRYRRLNDLLIAHKTIPGRGRISLFSYGTHKYYEGSRTDDAEVLRDLSDSAYRIPDKSSIGFEYHSERKVTKSSKPPIDAIVFFDRVGNEFVSARTALRRLFVGAPEWKGQVPRADFVDCVYES